MNERDHDLPADLRHVADRLRGGRHEADPLELDELKRRAMTQATRASRSGNGRAAVARSRFVTVMLVMGLGLTTSAAGVIAGQRDAAPEEQSAVISQYVVAEEEVAPPPVVAPEVVEPEPEPEAEEPAPEPEEAVTAPAPPAKRLPFTGTDILLLLALLGALSTAAGLGLRVATRRR